MDRARRDARKLVNYPPVAHPIRCVILRATLRTGTPLGNIRGFVVSGKQGGS